MDQIVYPARKMAPSGGSSFWKISNGNCKHNFEAVPLP